MTLRTQFGYPVGIAAALVGALRQSQRWLPRYEWVQPHQLGWFVAGINLSVLLVGVVGVFALGVRADRRLDGMWELSAAVKTVVLSAVGGVGIGTTLTFVLQPAHSTVTIRPLISFVGPMAVYVLSQGVPIGLVGVAGIASSRVHAGEATTDTRASVDAEFSAMARSEPTDPDVDPDTEPRPSPDTDSLGSR
ncbi:MAG: hypothetical protein ACOC0Z_00700 [Halohasta sp.]